PRWWPASTTIPPSPAPSTPASSSTAYTGCPSSGNSELSPSGCSTFPVVPSPRRWRDVVPDREPRRAGRPGDPVPGPRTTTRFPFPNPDELTDLHLAQCATCGRQARDSPVARVRPESPPRRRVSVANGLSPVGCHDGLPGDGYVVPARVELRRPLGMQASPTH